MSWDPLSSSKSLIRRISDLSVSYLWYLERQRQFGNCASKDNSQFSDGIKILKYLPGLKKINTLGPFPNAAAICCLRRLAFCSVHYELEKHIWAASFPPTAPPLSAQCALWQQCWDGCARHAHTTKSRAQMPWHLPHADWTMCIIHGAKKPSQSCQQNVSRQGS